MTLTRREFIKHSGIAAGALDIGSTAPRMGRREGR